MPRRLSPLFVATALVALTASALAEGEKVELRPHFEVGQKLTYRMAANTEGVRHQPDAKDTTQTASQEMTVTRKVTAVNEKSATVELTITHLKIKGQTPGYTVDYDSDTPEDQNNQNPVAAQFKGAVNKPITLTVSLDGEVTDVQAGPEVGPLGNLDSAKNQFAPLFRVKDGDPLTAVGDAWKSEHEQAMGGMGFMVVKLNDKLESVTDGVARVTFEGDMQPKDASKMPQIQFKTATIKGEYLWDIKRGIGKTYSLTQKIQIAGAVDMESTSTSNVTLVE